MQQAVSVPAIGSYRLGPQGYPCLARSQQLYQRIQPPPASASIGTKIEACQNCVDGDATTKTGASSLPVSAAAAPTESQEVVGTARLKTRGTLEEAAEFAALKAISARREAQMQQLEAELRRKDAAVKARDEHIAVLKRRCEELERHACRASPLETLLGFEAVQLTGDGPGQLGVEMETRTPRRLHGLAREDTAVRKIKVFHDTVEDEKCLPGYSRLLSTPSTTCSIACSDLEEELVPALSGSAAPGGTADVIDAKLQEYFARFPGFKLHVQQLKPGSYYFGEPVCQAVSVQLTRGGKAVLKVHGKFRSLDSFLDEVRGASRAACSLSPRSSFSSARCREDFGRSSSACRVGAAQRANSGARK